MIGKRFEDAGLKDWIIEADLVGNYFNNLVLNIYFDFYNKRRIIDANVLIILYVVFVCDQSIAY